jgi:hypothetical protein
VNGVFSTLIKQARIGFVFPENSQKHLKKFSKHQTRPIFSAKQVKSNVNINKLLKNVDDFPFINTLPSVWRTFLAQLLILVQSTYFVEFEH